VSVETGKGKEYTRSSSRTRFGKRRRREKRVSRVRSGSKLNSQQKRGGNRKKNGRTTRIYGDTGSIGKKSARENQSLPPIGRQSGQIRVRTFVTKSNFGEKVLGGGKKLPCAHFVTEKITGVERKIVRIGEKSIRRGEPVKRYHMGDDRLLRRTEKRRGEKEYGSLKTRRGNELGARN